MAGSRGTCGSRLPDMHYPQRLRSHTSNGKSSSHVRASKVPAENEGCSSRYDNSYHRSGSRSSSTYINSATDSTKQDYASASSSSSNCSSNSIAFDGRQTSFLPAMQNARYGIPGSSDESGSDLDIEVGESLISGIPAVIDPAGWDNLASSSVNKFSGLKSNLMEGDAGVSRRPKSHDVHTLSWRDRYMSQRARAHSPTSRSLFVDQGRPHGLATIGASHKSLWEGSSSKAPHIDDFTAPLSLDKKATLNVDCVCQSEIEGRVPVSGLSLPKNRIVAYSSRRLGQPTASAGDLQSNRKSSTQASYGRRMRPDDLGPGNREVNCIGAGTSRSRHSLSNLVCSSAADVLPPVSSSTLSNLVCSSAADVLPSASSSAVGAADRFCPRKNSRALGRIEEGEASRGMCLVKRQMGNGSVLGLGETFDSQGGQSQDQVFCEPDLEPSRSVRLSPPHLELETRCHRKPAPLETENVTHNASFSFTDNRSPPTNYGNRSPPTNYRHRGSNPVVQRSGDRRGPSSRSNNPFLEPIAFGELSNQCSIRRSLYVNQAVGLMGLDNEISNSHRSHSPPFGSTWSAMHEMRPSFSGPPTRPPPLPPSAVFAEPSASESGFPLTTLTTSPHLPHASQSTGSASPNREVEGSSSSIAEAAAFGSSTSTGETRSRLTVEGLSEILSALEYIERDEDLSYEQILMLEATILLGGIGLHDRYGDMRIDVDNMSYEELLALEERIGNVNTGLSEESIMKCMLIDSYASPGINSGYVPKDIEIKCSICQEEFEEAVELGVLECGHSHHIACIKQWLLQKNQCPICKASAVPQGHILHSVKH